MRLFLCALNVRVKLMNKISTRIKASVSMHKFLQLYGVYTIIVLFPVQSFCVVGRYFSGEIHLTIAYNGEEC